MKRGTCVKCGQGTVFAAIDGISPGSDSTNWVAAAGGPAPYAEMTLTTYACTSCGYFENYADTGKLAAVVPAWTKVEASS